MISRTLKNTNYYSCILRDSDYSNKTKQKNALESSGTETNIIGDYYYENHNSSPLLCLKKTLITANSSQ